MTIDELQVALNLAVERNRESIAARAAETDGGPAPSCNSDEVITRIRALLEPHVPVERLHWMSRSCPSSACAWLFVGGHR